MLLAKHTSFMFPSDDSRFAVVHVPGVCFQRVKHILMIVSAEPCLELDKPIML